MSVKIAVLALTAQGVKTAERIADVLARPTANNLIPAVEIFSHNHCAREYNSFSRLQDLMTKIWSKYAVIIFVMATGIVVRQVGPFLKSKDVDPAVLVIDENARFIIPLVSGHLGGANDWARRLAHVLDATAVITTATDGQGLVAPDEYARRLGWSITPLKNLPRLNRLLLERKYLKVWTEHMLAPDHPLAADENYVFIQEREQAELIVTAFPTDEASVGEKVFLIPRLLSLGIGCRQEISVQAIREGIARALTEIKAPASALKGIYSIDLKAREGGLIQAAQELGIPFITFSKTKIQAINEQYQLSKSDFVKKNIGVDGVCEPASLLGTQGGTLILPKLKQNGVSLAISQEKSLSWASDPETLLI
ncbi:MAG: cobalt-precorrin 5A hydrolase [Desulfitobacteriaceae bacterium]